MLDYLIYMILLLPIGWHLYAINISSYVGNLYVNFLRKYLMNGCFLQSFIIKKSIYYDMVSPVIVLRCVIVLIILITTSASVNPSTSCKMSDKWTHMWKCFLTLGALVWHFSNISAFILNWIEWTLSKTLIAVQSTII